MFKNSKILFFFAEIFLALKILKMALKISKANFTREKKSFHGLNSA